MSDPMTRLSTALEGRFRIQRPLGAGGMATVYLTEDLKNHRSVAMKVLRPELAEALGRERFLREIEIIANLNHPHILPLHDSDVVNDVYYFIMPYVEGESLRDRLAREGQLPIDDALRITREVADALAYAHSHGVVHRDIKPHNIMLQAGHALVTDFGIAHLGDDRATRPLTDTGVSLGTPQYMSPEQVSGALHVDGRSDIYSLGCVLYEMLAGQPPFTGPTVYAIMARQAAEAPPGMRVVRPTISDSLERVVFKALAKVPADRFRSAHDFARALTEVEHEVSTAERPALSSGGELVAGRASGQQDGGRDLTREDKLRAVRIALGLASSAALLVLIGILTTAFYDTELQVPRAYAPTRTDFLVTGARPLIPAAVYLLVGIVGIRVLRYLLPLLGRLMAAIPGIGSIARNGTHEMTTRFGGAMSRARPTAVADAFFLGAFAVAILLIFNFRHLIGALFTSDHALLGCATRDTWLAANIGLTWLIAGLAFAWIHVFRWVKSHGASLRGVAVARWGSAAIILVLIFILTLPWRLLWTSSERVRIGDERAYVVRETDSHLVLYNADTRRTTAYTKPAGDQIERLGIQGYVFEEPAMFDSGIPECESVRPLPTFRSPQ